MLRLLSLLQARREWSGRELADRLGVTERTLRRDIHRLRELDYPVVGSTGTAGGYRLASGQALPPLLLDDDEAVAIALALSTAVPGVDEVGARALAKLTQVLPARLRPQLARLADAVAVVPHRQAAGTDPGVLATLAAACRDTEIVTFDYHGRSGPPGRRRVEPHHLVTLGGNWYLVAYDPERADWRTFRLDRVRSPASTRHRFAPRALPAPDAATYLGRSFAGASYRYTARVEVALPADTVRTRMCLSAPGQVTELAPNRCLASMSADSLDLVVQYVAMVVSLDAPTCLIAGPEVTDRLRSLATSLAAAVEQSTVDDRRPVEGSAVSAVADAGRGRRR
ncbi:YafY family protein [Actinocatenispora sera]|uniref:helix-turn-helix transcriptional regulator n=1 Tax=Actinocatenispora sera TaxID=390989 RepID=UPI0033FE0271